MQSNASLSPSQARKGCREFSVGSLVSYHIDFFHPSEAHRLGPNAGENRGGLHFSSASREESTKRSTQMGEVAADSLRHHGEQEKMWSLALILLK